jgi:DNA-directed RNA polymerase subunit RPC12/RpoP
MVELVTPKCPRCGADLHLKPGQQMQSCEYCDSDVMVVDRPGGSQANDHAEIEKRKLALELCQRELAEVQSAAGRLQMEISMMQAQANRRGGKGTVGIIALLASFLMMDLIMFPLFYFLQMSGFYGTTQEMCLMIGVLVMVLCLAGIAAVYVGSARMASKRQAEIFQSPEFAQKNYELQQLQPAIMKAQADVQQADLRLRALVMQN